MNSEPVPLSDSFKVASRHSSAAGLVAEPDGVQQELHDLRERVDKLELAVHSPPEGLHNAERYAQQQEWFDRVEKGDSYKDRSLIQIMPGYKPIATAVWASWLRLSTPANHRVYRMYLSDFEVGDAYEKAIHIILSDPVLRDFSAVLTLEADNVVPPLAVLQLFEDMDNSGADVVGAMYWGKGAGGVPMAYGKFGETPTNFRPFVPPPDSVTRCNGVGMGCTLFKLDIFKRVSRPWFKTYQTWTPHVGMENLQTQDLFFAKKAAAEAGIKFAVSTNVLVGHLEESTGIIW